MQKTAQKIFLASIMVIMCASCSLRKPATAIIGKIATDGTVVVESEQDLDLARSSTPSLIITLEVLSKGNPADKRLATLLARSYGQYAFGFLEEDLIRYKDADKSAYQKSYDRADLFYQRGKGYGLFALWPKKEQEKILSLPLDDFKRRLAKFGKKDVPGLFWTAFCWGNWLNLHRDDPDAFIDLPRVEAMISRVVQLNPSYYYGSAYSFLATIAAIRPKMLGGDLDLARDEFEKALQVDNGYLMTKVLYAQFYAVQAQDPELFEKLLSQVQNADVKLPSNQRLANELAKRRAALLIEKKKKFF
jgi:hypothetical protein